MNDNVSSENKGCDISSPKFYPKSLTLLQPILKMIEEGLGASEIAEELDLSRQRVSYHIRKLNGCGYVKENGRDAFKLLGITQAGKNFLDRCEKGNPTPLPPFRLEKLILKADVIEMPSIQVQE